MGSTFLSLNYHIVFSTKDRRPLIQSKWLPYLHEYLGGTASGLDGKPISIGGVADHVHLLLGLKSTHCLADFIRELKKASSIWAADNHDRAFGWQDGYAAFTISSTHLPRVSEYIENQEAHHRKLTFQDELRRILKKNNVKFEEKYLT
jgi:REP element-mobilizing transposase RayT